MGARAYMLLKFALSFSFLCVCFARFSLCFSGLEHWSSFPFYSFELNNLPSLTSLLGLSHVTGTSSSYSTTISLTACPALVSLEGLHSFGLNVSRADGVT